MEKIIDLHIHTNYSDGSLSPMEIVDEAEKNGVSIISIADHDTIDAYTKELLDYAANKHIKVIPAVEVSTKTSKAGIHVLGYNFDLANPELKDRLYSIRNARHIYLQNVASKLQELGYIIHTAELDKIDAVTKAHISFDVVANLENAELLLKEFGHIPGKGEFIETVMNEGCPAYVEKETITPKEAASLLRHAGGKVILAHPVAYKYEDNLTSHEILQLIKDMNADGIEANYIYIDRNNNKIDEVDQWNRFANENHLIVTVGSDFHTQDGIHPQIGLINGDIQLSEKEIDTIINNLLN